MLVVLICRRHGGISEDMAQVTIQYSSHMFLEHSIFQPYFFGTFKFHIHKSITESLFSPCHQVFTVTAPYAPYRAMLIPAGLDAASSLSIVHSLKKLTQLGLISVGKLDGHGWLRWSMSYVICVICVMYHVI